VQGLTALPARVKQSNQIEAAKTKWQANREFRVENAPIKGLAIGQDSCPNESKYTNGYSTCEPETQRGNDKCNETLAFAPDVRVWPQCFDRSLSKEENSLLWMPKVVKRHWKLTGCNLWVSLSKHLHQSAALNCCRETQNRPNAHHQNWPQIAHEKSKIFCQYWL
jgi:hypothetical protein